MPKDNFETSPDIIRARQSGNNARLNMELATQSSQTVRTDVAAGSSAALSIGTELANRTGAIGGGGGFHPCFTGETMVGEKRIDELRIGDFVPSFDFEKGMFGEARVTKVLIHETTEILDIALENGKSLRVTPEHLVWGKTGFRAIGEFAVGDALYNEWMEPVVITAINREILDEPVLVFNLETETHTYYAGGFLVHNAKAPEDL